MTARKNAYNSYLNCHGSPRRIDGNWRRSVSSMKMRERRGVSHGEITSLQFDVVRAPPNNHLNYQQSPLSLERRRTSTGSRRKFTMPCDTQYSIFTTFRISVFIETESRSKVRFRKLPAPECRSSKSTRQDDADRGNDIFGMRKKAKHVDHYMHRYRK
jgi:hypothetical protein